MFLKISLFLKPIFVHFYKCAKTKIKITATLLHVLSDVEVLDELFSCFSAANLFLCARCVCMLVYVYMYAHKDKGH